jgi:hypothetical protein
MLTFAETLLVLDRAGRRRALDLLAATHSRYLASAAKWSKQAGELFEKFAAEIRETIDPDAPKPSPRKYSGAQIAALFRSLGVPQATNN